jgi:hypothetical protein
MDKYAATLRSMAMKEQPRWFEKALYKYFQ